MKFSCDFFQFQKWVVVQFSEDSSVSTILTKWLKCQTYDENGALECFWPTKNIRQKIQNPCDADEKFEIIFSSNINNKVYIVGEIALQWPGHSQWPSPLFSFYENQPVAPTGLKVSKCNADTHALLYFSLLYRFKEDRQKLFSASRKFYYNKYCEVKIDNKVSSRCQFMYFIVIYTI